MATGGWVYIMANRCRGGMYVGVTSEANNPDWHDLWSQWFGTTAEQEQPSPVSSTG